MEAFGRALAALAAPGGVDPSARAEAERIVAVAVEDPSVVPALLEACRRPDPPSRLLAAVLLSTAAGKHWRSLSDRDVEAVQSGVLAALGAAESSAELRALAHAADVVAQASAAAGTPWEALLPALRDAARSPSPTHREAALVLFGDLLESTGAHLAPHHREIAAACLAEASREDSSDVDASAPLGSAPLARAPRLAALAALARLARALGEVGDFPVVAELAPAILRCALDNCEAAFTAGDDERMRRALATLADVVALPSDEAVFGPEPAAALLPTLRAVVRVATDGASSASWCGPAWDVLGTIAEAHAGLLDAPRKDLAAFFPAAAGRGAVSVAELLLPPLCDAARSDERGDEDASDTVDDAEASGPGAHARAALRRCAAALPPAATLPAALAPVAAAADATGPSAEALRGALAAFAVVVEACACELESDAGALEAALRAIARSFQSGDPATARRGALALAELAEHAGAALAASEATAARVLELAADATDIATEAEAEGASARADARVLEGFCAAARLAVAKIAENFAGDELAPGLERLTRALVRGAAAGRAAAARARCLDVLAAVVRAAAWEFEPFAAETLNALAPTAFAGSSGSASEGAAAEVRFRAVAAMATVVAAAGFESAPAGTTEALLDAACAGLAAGGGGGGAGATTAATTGASTALECSLRCFARLASTLESRLAPWIERAGRVALDAVRAEAAGRGSPGGGRRGRAAVTTGDAAVSVAAAEALGAMCNSCGAAARPLAAAALDALVEVATSPFASFAARLAATRAAEFAAHPWDEPAEAAASEEAAPGARLARILDAAPRAAEAATRLADVLAREETPEVALAAAVSLETAAERCRRVANALGSPGAEGEDARVAAARKTAREGAEAAARAFRAVLDGAVACQEELGEGGGGGHGGGDGEEHGMVFVDLEEMARRALEGER